MIAFDLDGVCPAAAHGAVHAAALADVAAGDALDLHALAEVDGVLEVWARPRCARASDSETWAAVRARERHSTLVHAIAHASGAKFVGGDATVLENIRESGRPKPKLADQLGGSGWWALAATAQP